MLPPGSTLTLPDSTCVHRAPGVVERAYGGERILLQVKTRRIVRLNRTAALIWDRADGATPLRAICDALEAHFMVDHNQARADIERCLYELAANGVATIAAAAP
jgi:hypothetical protein